MASRIPVWDAPVRLFHWALAAFVLFSYATGKIGGYWLEWHMRSGYAILALLAFRIAWGIVGSETARFASFLRGPRATLDYARHLFAHKGPMAAGHTPTGGWMIVAPWIGAGGGAMERGSGSISIGTLIAKTDPLPSCDRTVSEWLSRRDSRSTIDKPRPKPAASDVLDVLPR